MQGAIVETEELVGFIPEYPPEQKLTKIAEHIIDKIKSAQRPVIFVGNGVITVMINSP